MRSFFAKDRKHFMKSFLTSTAFAIFITSSTSIAFSQEQASPVNKQSDIVFATREAKESWRLLAEKFKLAPTPERGEPAVPVKTAFDSRVPGAQLIVPAVPAVKTFEELLKFFNYVRDTRYLQDPQPTYESFLRRIPWLFPDDGCFMRAFLVNELLKKNFQQETGRAFVFGDLWVDSPQSAKRIHWWYHTAATIKLNEVVYVIDIAIDATKALPLKEWVAKQNVIFESAEVSLCEANTYFPNQECQRSGSDELMASEHSVTYLNAERSRQVELHRDEAPSVIDAILGEKPPWQTL